MQTVIIIILIALLVLALVLWLITNNLIRKKYKEAELLNCELSALADVYEAMTLIDLKTDQMTLLRSNEFHDALLQNDLSNYRSRICNLSKKIASNEAGEILSKFMDPSTYEERLQHVHSVSHDFLDNKESWVRFQLIVADRDEDGKLWHIIWAVESINEERKQQDHLRKLAETDALSQLKNRSTGETHVRQKLSKGIKGVFILMDVDEFKSVNDTFGHDVGDKVIIAVADAIRESFRESDIAFRLGGDEFAVFLTNVETPDLTNMLVDRLTDEIARISLPELEGRSITVSVGTAYYPTGADDKFETLYQRADKEMYENKRRKKAERAAAK